MPERRSGRTKGMLEQALACALKGKDCFVVMSSRDQCKYAVDFLQSICKKRAIDPVIVWKSWQVGIDQAVINFTTHKSDRLNLDRMRVAGYPAATPIFVDHHVDEMRKETSG